MTICEFCIDTLFNEAYWKTKEKPHHTKSAVWEDSIKRCTICSSLLDDIKDVVVKSSETHISNTLDTYLRFDSILDTGILGILNHMQALPVYNVTLGDSPARDQFTLIFSPIEENVQKIEIATAFGNVHGIVLPLRKFQVYSIDYDNSDIPRLSNETSLNSRDNQRNERTSNQITGWIKECNKKHVHCQRFTRHPAQKSFVPTRLIDVGKETDNHVKLVETGGKAEFQRYATLSHCWGGFITVCTYDYNYEQRKKIIPFEANFPRNFLDSINLCRTLGIEYLWIDSLCIKQGSAEDWVKEAPRMHEVYGSSYLNIAATSARNSTEGLFRKRRINLLSPSVVPCNWQGRSQYCKVIREDFWRGELLNEPLYKRAWVSQERMLAPRTLNFGTKQLFWQCLTIAACETMPNGIPRVIRSAGQEELQWRRLLHESRDDKTRQHDQPHPSGEVRRPGEARNDDKVELQAVWRDAVKNFTSCNITNTVDKLPAVAGLAQVMHDCCQEDYVAGLWTDKDDDIKLAKKAGKQIVENPKLVLQLSWRVKNCRNVDGRPSRRQRQDEYRAPTWAWPSVVDGIIEIPVRTKVETNTTVTVQLTEKPHLVYAEKDQVPAQKFMSLKGGWINAKGPLYSVPFYDTRDVETPYWCWWIPKVPYKERPLVELYPDEPLTFPDADTAILMDAHDEGLSHMLAHRSETAAEATLHSQLEKNGPRDAETPNADPVVYHSPRNFTILVIYQTNEDGYFSGRALVLQEELDETKYSHIPEKDKRHAMFTRIGMVEFRKVPGYLWEYFRKTPYKPKGYYGEAVGDEKISDDKRAKKGGNVHDGDKDEDELRKEYEGTELTLL